MSNSSNDLVVIREPAPTIAGLNHPIYSVHYLRIVDDDDLGELLTGKPLDEFEPSRFLLRGEILASSGATTVEEVARLAKATLADAGSEPRRAGLAPNTPIYHARPGEPLVPV